MHFCRRKTSRYKRTPCASRWHTSGLHGFPATPGTRNQANMNDVVKCTLSLAIVFGIVYGASADIDDSDRNIMPMNFPYGRGLDSDIQLSRLLAMPQRLCHPKRNSELINSLLGLPKNMNNAGK